MLELKQKNVRNSIGKKNLFFMFVNCSVDITDPQTKFNLWWKLKRKNYSDKHQLCDEWL
jgi:hypothetical protein